MFLAMLDHLHSWDESQAVSWSQRRPWLSFVCSWVDLKLTDEFCKVDFTEPRNKFAYLHCHSQVPPHFSIQDPLFNAERPVFHQPLSCAKQEPSYIKGNLRCTAGVSGSVSYLQAAIRGQESVYNYFLTRKIFIPGATRLRQNLQSVFVLFHYLTHKGSWWTAVQSKYQIVIWNCCAVQISEWLRKNDCSVTLCPLPLFFLKRRWKCTHT